MHAKFNRHPLLADIAEKVQRFGRTPDTVELLAVSKQQNSQSIRALYQQGIHSFGENYLQEAMKKIHELQDLAINWHYIGAIQSNKSALIAQHFNWVHTVDRVKIAKLLSAHRPSHCQAQHICVQVNIDKEPTKAGVMPEDLPALLAEIEDLPKLKLRGLMCIPKKRTEYKEQMMVFRQLRDLQEKMQAAGFCLDTLSMGMSEDYTAAIAQGATILRIDTKLFGSRV